MVQKKLMHIFIKGLNLLQNLTKEGNPEPEHPNEVMESEARSHLEIGAKNG